MRVSTRSEHVQRSRDKALVYLNKGSLLQAYVCFTSEMSKHEEASMHIGLKLGVKHILSGLISTPKDLIDWMNGFN